MSVKNVLVRVDQDTYEKWVDVKGRNNTWEDIIEKGIESIKDK